MKMMEGGQRDVAAGAAFIPSERRLSQENSSSSSPHSHSHPLIKTVRVTGLDDAEDGSGSGEALLTLRKNLMPLFDIVPSLGLLAVPVVRAAATTATDAGTSSLSPARSSSSSSSFSERESSFRQGVVVGEINETGERLLPQGLSGVIEGRRGWFVAGVEWAPSCVDTDSGRRRGASTGSAGVLLCVVWRRCNDHPEEIQKAASSGDTDRGGGGGGESDGAKLGHKVEVYRVEREPSRIRTHFIQDVAALPDIADALQGNVRSPLAHWVKERDPTQTQHTSKVALALVATSKCLFVLDHGDEHLVKGFSMTSSQFVVREAICLAKPAAPAVVAWATGGSCAPVIGLSAEEALCFDSRYCSLTPNPSTSLKVPLQVGRNDEVISLRYLCSNAQGRRYFAAITKPPIRLSAPTSDSAVPNVLQDSPTASAALSGTDALSMPLNEIFALFNKQRKLRKRAKQKRIKVEAGGRSTRGTNEAAVHSQGSERKTPGDSCIDLRGLVGGKVESRTTSSIAHLFDIKGNSRESSAAPSILNMTSSLSSRSATLVQSLGSTDAGTTGSEVKCASNPVARLCILCCPAPQPGPSPTTLHLERVAEVPVPGILFPDVFLVTVLDDSDSSDQCDVRFVAAVGSQNIEDGGNHLHLFRGQLGFQPREVDEAIINAKPNTNRPCKASTEQIQGVCETPPWLSGAQTEQDQSTAHTRTSNTPSTDVATLQQVGTASPPSDTHALKGAMFVSKISACFVLCICCLCSLLRNAELRGNHCLPCLTR